MACAFAAAMLTLGACGGGERLSGDERSGLPLIEFELQHLCPGRSDLQGAAAVRLRQQSLEQLDALLAAYAEHPDAEVDITVTPADEPNTDQREVSLRYVVESNLAILERTRCDPRSQRRLRDALGS